MLNNLYTIYATNSNDGKEVPLWLTCNELLTAIEFLQSLHSQTNTDIILHIHFSNTKDNIGYFEYLYNKVQFKDNINN